MVGQRRIVPHRRMQTGEVAQRVGGLVDRAPVDLHPGARGREVVEEQHERAVVVADLRVPAAWRADLHAVAEHRVEADLVAVAGSDALACRARSPAAVLATSVGGSSAPASRCSRKLAPV